MRNALRASLAVLLLAAAMFAADEGRFFTYPTIAGDRIVFTYESDLWTASAKGGAATRLTTFPGTESFAKLSPDGKWIAFTASYDGAQAVYLMPAEGGAPVRLTYNPGGAQVIAWTPDGTEIVFRSMFENVVGRDPNLYFVSIKGGAPSRLPLDRGVLVSFCPTSTRSSTPAGATRNTTGSAIRAASIRTSGSSTPRPAPTRRSRATSARTPTRCGSAGSCTSSATRPTASPTSTR